MNGILDLLHYIDHLVRTHTQDPYGDFHAESVLTDEHVRSVPIKARMEPRFEHINVVIATGGSRS